VSGGVLIWDTHTSCGHVPSHVTTMVSQTDTINGISLIMRKALYKVL